MFYFVTAKISRDFHCVCYCYVSSTLNLLFLCLEVCLKKSVFEIPFPVFKRVCLCCCCVCVVLTFCSSTDFFKNLLYFPIGVVSTDWACCICRLL